MNLKRLRFFKCSKACLKVIFVLMCISPGYVFSTERPDTSKTLCQNHIYVDEIQWLWKQRKSAYEQWMINSDKTPLNLYKIQGETNNLLKYAVACKDGYILDELISLYLMALDTLDETDQYAFYYFPMNKRRTIHPLNQKSKMWLDEKEPVGDESILTSAQFLALVSEVINNISDINEPDRSPEMRKFIRKYSPVLVEHYDRWILQESAPFQLRGWGCTVKNKFVKTGMNHKEFIEKKMDYQLGDSNSHLYCNAITDTDLWIFSGVSNLLAAAKKNAQITLGSPQNTEKFYSYLVIGLELVASRISKSNLIDFEGGRVLGGNFDLGVWDDYYEYEYSSKNNEKIYEIKKLVKKMPAKNVGWDLSHARRFIHVFDSFYRNKNILNVDFPSKKIMTELTNQLVYGVFNKNFKFPLFANYMDGSNGWFRVGYLGRKGFGVAPWDMSISVLTGGYGYWSIYNKDIEKIFESIVDLINSDDPVARNHIEEHYEKNYWSNFERRRYIDFKDKNNFYTQSILIQLLPSMCFYPIDSSFPVN